MCRGSISGFGDSWNQDEAHGSHNPGMMGGDGEGPSGSGLNNPGTSGGGDGEGKNTFPDFAFLLSVSHGDLERFTTL